MAHSFYDYHDFVYPETSSKLNDAKCLLVHLTISILLSKQSRNCHSIPAVYAGRLQVPELRSDFMVGKLLALIPYFMIAVFETYRLVLLLCIFFSRLLYRTFWKAIISLQSWLCRKKHTTLSVRVPRPMSTR